MNYQIKYKVILISCCVLVSFKALALKSDESAPIHITANEASLDQKNKLTTATGNVVITKGSLVVHANLAVASKDALGTDNLALTGSPVTFSQLSDDQGLIEGQGNSFNYNSKSGIAILSGRARIKKGKNVVVGEKITYNTKTQMYSATSGLGDNVNKSSSGRVTIILDQNEMSPKAK